MEKVLLVVLGAIIGAVPTILIGWMNLKAEKERQIRELGLEMALSEYKIQCELVFREGKGIIMPPVAFIGTAYQGVKKLMDNDLDPSQFKKAYKDLAKVVKEYGEIVREHSVSPTGSKQDNSDS